MQGRRTAEEAFFGKRFPARFKNWIPWNEIFGSNPFVTKFNPKARLGLRVTGVAEKKANENSQPYPIPPIGHIRPIVVKITPRSAARSSPRSKDLPPRR